MWMLKSSHLEGFRHLKVNLRFLQMNISLFEEDYDKGEKKWFAFIAAEVFKNKLVCLDLADYLGISQEVEMMGLGYRLI